MASGSGHVLYRNLRQQYETVLRGEGVWLYTDAGRYLDATAGAGVVAIGHGRTEIAEALAAAGDKVPFVYAGAFTHPWQEELASRIVALSPKGMSSVYFVSGGSEANETAWKIARQYHVDRGKPGKCKAIARRQGYHGVTLATLSLSGRRSWRELYDPLLVGKVAHVQAPYSYRRPEGATLESFCRDCIDDFERTILFEGPDTIACFFAEPIGGPSISAMTPPEGYYQGIRELCDKYDILFVADEVLTGYGRCGTTFAISQWQVVPDILTMGKAIGSGYTPLGAAVVAEHIRESIRQTRGSLVHGFTYNGNPTACFIGLRVYDILLRDGLIERPAQIGAYLFEQLEALQQKHSIIGDVRGRGLLAGIEFVADRKSKRPFPVEANLTQRIVAGMRQRGVLVTAGIAGVNAGCDGDHIQLTPPFVISKSEIDIIITVLDEVLLSLKKI